uniref:Immunoglobulin domain-containing protein n=1 Tax=Sinocyclocheilus anshuiensis TaxID=1608454 RepID=A0A671LX58_9TELE
MTERYCHTCKSHHSCVISYHFAVKFSGDFSSYLQKVKRSFFYYFHIHSSVIFCDVSPQKILLQLLVCVSDVPAAEQDKMKRKSVKEGESITLHLDGVKKTNNLKIWYFNDTLITEITGDQSKICTDEQCKERFRDRLKLNDQTGSLTIINTRTTDSGLYKLQINSSRFSIIKTFSVTVTGDPSLIHLLLLLLLLLLFCDLHK